MTEYVTEAAYRALVRAATDGIVREIVDLHKPVPYKVYKAPDTGYDRDADGNAVVWWECKGCEFGGYDGEPPQWPCATSTLIAQRVGVHLRDDAYYFDHAAERTAEVVDE